MNYIKFMIFLAVFTSIASNASDLTCPATVKAGAKLSGISGSVYNDDCTKPLDISSRILSIMGNSGSGTIGLRGPFVKTYPTFIVIPPPRCGGKTHMNFGFNFAIASVPANTLAAISAAVIDTHNKIHVVGTCHIRVVP